MDGTAFLASNCEAFATDLPETMQESAAAGVDLPFSRPDPRTENMAEMQSEDDSPLLSTKEIGWCAGLSIIVFSGLCYFVGPLSAGFGAYLFFTMVLITLADLRYFIIPDVLSLPAIPIGLLANTLLASDGDWRVGISGALIGGGVFYLLRTIYFRLRGAEGLGLGDVKLAAVAGAWLGPALLAPACMVATLSAIAGVLVQAAVRGRGTFHARMPIPFGSFIAPTILFLWIWSVPFW